MMNKGYIKLLTILLTTQLIFVGITSSNATENIVKNVNEIDGYSGIEISFKSGQFELYGEIYYPSNGNGVYPGIVFCEGIYGYISAYNWIPKALAEEGYVVLIFDPPSQGFSMGFLPKLLLTYPKLNLLISLTAIVCISYRYVLYI